MSLIKIFFDICLLRGRPQDLPVSLPLVVGTALVSMGVDFLLASEQERNFTYLSFAFTQTVLFGAVIWGALQVRGFPQRWMQTIAPLYIANALVSLVSWPVYVDLVGKQTIQLNLGQGLYLLACLGWFIAVMAHVLRQALEIAFGLSILVTMMCLFISGIALMLLFPVMAPSA